MEYSKTIYVDHITPLNAENLNKSELAIEQISKDIGQLGATTVQIAEQVNTKADKVHNHDELYASKVDEHNHNNIAELDSITNIKIQEWDKKSNFSGSYNDLTDIPPNSYSFDITSEQWRRIEELYEYNMSHNLNNLEIDCDLYVDNKKVLADIEPLNENELKIITTENYNAKVVIKLN